MKNLSLLVILSSVFLTFGSANAQDTKTMNASPKAKLREPAEYQKIIDEYKEYSATVPVEVREEIIEYRKAIAQLNKQKIELYKKLTQAAQNYLKETQEYKKKLPTSKRKLLLDKSMTGAKTPNNKEGNKTK